MYLPFISLIGGKVNGSKSWHGSTVMPEATKEATLSAERGATSTLASLQYR